MGIEPTYSGSAVPLIAIKPLNYHEVRSRFIEWLTSRGYTTRYAKNVVSYLDRYVIEIKQPLDVALLFNKLQNGKRNLAKSLRVLFNFYQLLGISQDYLDSLCKALPKTESGIDLKIPNEIEIIDSLRKCRLMPIEYNALYNLLCDSGLRLIEATHVINSFKDTEPVNGFYRTAVAMFRGCKQSYHSHFSKYTLNLLHQVERKLNEQIASTFFDKKNVVNPKYLRKYVFDKMIELEIPESVADFIEGRVPNRIGAKHYMALARQASNFYPRYLSHIENLRQRISN